jgi:hypothetical protein
MTDIYFNASAVICWLGEEAENSGIALYLLDELSRAQETPTESVMNAIKEVTRFKEALVKLLERGW